VSLSGLLPLLSGAPAYAGLRDALRAGRAAAVTAPDHAQPYLLAALWRDAARPVVVVCPHPDDARLLAVHLEAYLGDDAPVVQFAESELLPFERLSIEPATVHQRIGALGALHRPGPGGPPLVVTSVTGLMQKTLDPAVFAGLVRTVRRDERVRADELLKGWVNLGYQVGPTVEGPGQAARRGGIVDIYPPGVEDPYRLDLWGDVVDTVRTFDVGSQRSTGAVPEALVLPAAELLPAHVDRAGVDALLAGLDFANTRPGEQDRVHEEMAGLLTGMADESAALYAGFLLQHTLLDHLGAVPGALVVVVEPGEAAEAARRLEGQAEALRLAKEERGELPLHFPSALVDWDTLAGALEAWPARLALSRYAQPSSGGLQSIALPFEAAPVLVGSAEGLAGLAHAGLDRAPVVVATNHSRRVEELLREEGVGAREVRSLDEAPAPGSVSVVHVGLPGGWRLDSGEGGAPLAALLTDDELFGAAKRRPVRARRHAPHLRAASVDELTPGQYVVHIEHGIGRFVGTQTRPTGPGGTNAEYLVLEYAEGDRLFVPMEQLDRLSPYQGADEASPSPTRLGTQEWSRAVSRARESTQKLAVDLLALYAQREMAQGTAYGPDTVWQREMEDAFPYVETPDQQSAIDDVKGDMERVRPMDRLVCGDVGYGKTEVALRAAFKAVMDGRQVAVLVPTTVLALQHYETFSERLAPFPVKVEMLSRFRTPAEQDEIIAKLKAGELDMVVGTHRLVSKDVGFKDLGLVIIDEEHRFGVGHKERLKELRSEVDVLTMTATPIPRTLHMAMAGIRDISTIETPPEERLPIRTYLAEDSDDLVREAILRELDRGGQVFYLHNRVKSIDLAAGRVAGLLPEARVMVAHGQMHEDELADAMERFAAGEADVLVCTTIIESGLDIPAVNTLIVDHADRLGLAQLYQLRGRVGRRSQRAYAYLLVERGHRLTEVAQRRLQTIAAATELGAGFRIAMKDLEIRGAGNLLGPEQSGQIHAVGFDLYTKLLAEAVATLRAQTGIGGVPEGGVPVPEGPDPVVDLGVSAAITEELVPHMPTRMALYQRVARARETADLADLSRELEDRFGRPLPDPLHHLLYVARVRVLARRARVESVTKRDERISLKLVDAVGGARVPLSRALGHRVEVGNQQMHLHTGRVDVPWAQALLEVLERLAAFQQQTAAIQA
jgi:transcription-repair coupling factor (superfamily II helicase)